MVRKPTVLCILDGYGLNPSSEGNAAALAQTPNIDRVLETSVATTLITHGERVGLPAGQMGNSEVGHLNIGAGRVVEQWLLRINRALGKGHSRELERLEEFVADPGQGRRIHLIGLFSDGGVHSHSDHLLLLLNRFARTPNLQFTLHIITDGRDTDPRAALANIQALEQRLSLMPNVEIGTVSGRFYGMDRDQRWERIELAYRAIACADGPKTSAASAWVSESYAANTTDEFVVPAVVGSYSGVKDTDQFIFWNFRADRMRELVTALCLGGFQHFRRPAPVPPHKHALCMTCYDPNFGLPYLFEQIEITNHLGAVVSQAGLHQLRTAETEKYPHVTYFFNGGIETPLPGEERVLIPSPRDVKTYDLKPEMSASEVCDIVVDSILAKKHDLIVVNFANCDMVGHTGSLPAAIAAVEAVDRAVGRILAALGEAGGQAIITADHGNAEQMIDYESGSPHTAHTTFPVPFAIFNAESKFSLTSNGSLCDIAPTVLELMGLKQPKEMTGTSLIQRQDN